MPAPTTLEPPPAAATPPPAATPAPQPSAPLPGHRGGKTMYELVDKIRAKGRPTNSPEPRPDTSAAKTPPVTPASKPETVAPPNATTPTAKTDAKPDTEDTTQMLDDGETASEVPSTESPPTTETPSDAAAPEKAKEKKVSPWRLADQWKEKATKLEAELAEIKTKSIPEANAKELQERLSKAETRSKELEEELRYLDYQKHDPEFQEKYLKPYEQAWKRAVAELNEVTITDSATGAVRSATAEDLLVLINLPLGKAREQAKELFGDFADDAMAHRKEIKSLYEAQTQKLDEAKKVGAERQKQKIEQAQQQHGELVKQVTEIWNRSNQEVVTDTKYGEYFAPKEGDQDGNARLAKGFELADRAFRENPLDPSLTAEQRAAIIRRHAAVRNRSAAFSRLTSWLKQRDAKIASLEAELLEYKRGEPGAGEGNSQKTESVPQSGMERLKAALRSKAK